MTFSTMCVARTVLLALLVFVSTSARQPVCTTDDDCVPSSCCHAQSCVHRSLAASLDCANVLCNAQCKSFTLDCGGECRCTNGNCTSVIRAGRPPPGVDFKAPTDPPKGFTYVKVKRVVSVPRSQARELKKKHGL